MSAAVCFTLGSVTARLEPAQNRLLLQEPPVEFDHGLIQAQCIGLRGMPNLHNLTLHLEEAGYGCTTPQHLAALQEVATCALELLRATKGMSANGVMTHQLPWGRLSIALRAVGLRLDDESESP